MKKNILLSVVALALMLTISWGVSKSIQSDNNLSDLALNNVEALAQNEDGGAGGCYQVSNSWSEEFGCQATWFSCNDGSGSSCIEGLKVRCPDGSSSDETITRNCVR